MFAKNVRLYPKSLNLSLCQLSVSIFAVFALLKVEMDEIYIVETNFGGRTDTYYHFHSSDVKLECLTTFLLKVMEFILFYYLFVIEASI